MRASWSHPFGDSSKPIALTIGARGLRSSVRERRQELVLVLIGEPQRSLGVSAFVRFLLQCAIRLFECGRALADFREHRVECVDEHADLIIRRAGRAQGEVAPLDDLPRNDGDGAYGARDAAREPKRNQHRD